jgi:hypothetical protein
MVLIFALAITAFAATDRAPAVADDTANLQAYMGTKCLDPAGGGGGVISAAVVANPTKEQVSVAQGNATLSGNVMVEVKVNMANDEANPYKNTIVSKVEVTSQEPGCGNDQGMYLVHFYDDYDATGYTGLWAANVPKDMTDGIGAQRIAETMMLETNEPARLATYVGGHGVTARDIVSDLTEGTPSVILLAYNQANGLPATLLLV